MKVVHIQYRASSSGDFSRRLHKAMLDGGIESSILTLFPDETPGPLYKSLGRIPRLRSKLDNHLQVRLTGRSFQQYGLFSYPLLGSDISGLEQVRQADVIYLHWALFGFLNLRSIEALAKLQKPIVVIMHDMWSITGGCHYSFECTKYQSGCSDCQHFNGGQWFDLAASGFRRKQRLYNKYDNFYFVSPSSWLYDCARRSALTGHKPVFHIPNVLDQERFKPIDKKVARQIFNIPAEDRVIAFGAVSIDSPYKGWTYLSAALQILYEREKAENITILVFGGGDQQALSEAIPFKTHFLGRITDEHAMAVVYNAADVLIAPSTADNLPYVIFESLACGTPVVAFEVGGIPDLIRHRHNGYLARYKDSEDLAEGISYCLHAGLKGEVLPEFDTAATIAQHLQLIEKIKPKHPHGHSS